MLTSQALRVDGFRVCYLWDAMTEMRQLGGQQPVCWSRTPSAMSCSRSCGIAAGQYTGEAEVVLWGPRYALELATRPQGAESGVKVAFVIYSEGGVSCATTRPYRHVWLEIYADRSEQRFEDWPVEAKGMKEESARVFAYSARSPDACSRHHDA